MNEFYVPMIDTSRWQFDATGIVNWNLAASKGVKVNLIRAGKGNSQFGSDHGRDLFLNQNVAATVAAGLDWTVYWRLDNMGQDDPESQANLFVDIYESLPNRTSAPLVIDSETYIGPQLEIIMLRHWYNEFRAQIEKRGYHVAVYSSRSYWDSFVKLGWGELDLLCAHWVKDPNDSTIQLDPVSDPKRWPGFAFHYMMGPNIPNDWATWSTWQFSSKGNGIELGAKSLNIDCNIMKLETYHKWFGK